MGIFNDRLRELRDSSKMTSKELAKKLNIAESKLSYYMSGDREPSYDLLIAIANEFDVTTDYLVGKSNQKTYAEEKLAQAIQSKSETSTVNSKRKAEIENESVRIHDILVNFANIETIDNNYDDIWEMVKIWIDGLSLYFNFIKNYLPPKYPLDEAKSAMDTFAKAGHIAAKRVGKMLREILEDDKIDKKIKSRIVIEQAFSIKSDKQDSDQT